MKRYLIIMVLLTTLFSTACGQPGPLYLPVEAPATQAQPGAKIKPPKELRSPDEQAEPESEPQTDLYYPY